MKKKKPTKAQIKAMECEQKRSFINHVYELVLHRIAHAASHGTSSVTIQCTQKSTNRYVRFHIYGCHLAVLIFRDGNIGLELEEALHTPYKQIVFPYSENVKEQSDFMVWLDQMLTWLIPIFVGEQAIDLHSFMDYVSEVGNPSDAYDEVKAKWRLRPLTEEEAEPYEAGHQ